MRAMPKTLDTQGFSGLREEVVRSEGRTSRSPVLQALIVIRFFSRGSQSGASFFDIFAGFVLFLGFKQNPTFLPYISLKF